MNDFESLSLQELLKKGHPKAAQKIGSGVQEILVGRLAPPPSPEPRPPRPAP